MTQFPQSSLRKSFCVRVAEIVKAPHSTGCTASCQLVAVAYYWSLRRKTVTGMLDLSSHQLSHERVPLLFTLHYLYRCKLPSDASQTPRTLFRFGCGALFQPHALFFWQYQKISLKCSSQKGCFASRHMFHPTCCS